MKKSILIFLIALVFSGEILAQKNDVASNSYWTQGKAEVNVYEVSQNRYKENHPGQLVSVFVTEDFLTDKQVKNETYTSKSSTWILKNIQLKKFTTGVYDYSLFSSVFTPIDRGQFPKSLKVSASSQEWCGTIYTQFNLIFNTDYKVEHRSYFEKEGDKTTRIKRSFLEDEVFTVLRMNPTLLPKGNVQFIPPANYIQMKHLPLQSFKAKTTLNSYDKEDLPGGDLMEYKIEYVQLKRTMRIVFENKAPYKIIGWFETFPSAFDGKLRTTRAVLKQQKMLPYWSQNSLKDATLRKELGLN
tara:strand:- start:2653 stop:3552 length:900 start_codon:yes stop_codon:yes gene_type:complete